MVEGLLLGEAHGNPERHRQYLQVLQARLAAGELRRFALESAWNDVGVPLYFAVRWPDTRVLSVGFVGVDARRKASAQCETGRAGDVAPYDILWFTPRAEHPDPGLAFRK